MSDRQIRQTRAAEGTVFDIGYQTYLGPREGRARARLAVYKNGIRIALGIGRGPRAKILPWIFIGSLSAIALIMALVAGATGRLLGTEMAQNLNLPSHSDFYGMASIIFFLFAAVVAPELLCPDRRDGTINLYLVRPLNGSDYIITRWLSFFTVSALVAWLPQVVLWIGLTMGNPVPFAYFRDNWLDIPRFLAAGLTIAAYTSTIAMVVAGFTTRRAYASAFLVGLFVITTPFTTGLASEVGGTTGRWISMFNLSNIPVHVNDVIFGDTSAITRAAPASRFPDWLLVSWAVAWTVIPAGILWGRYRKLTP